MSRGLLLSFCVVLGAVIVVKSGVFAFSGEDWSLHARKRPVRTLPSHRDPVQRAGNAERLPAATAGDNPSMPARLALGQMVVARFDGANPSSAFLARIRRGEIGAVIVFEENLSGGGSAIAARIARLQAAAGKGGNPPLLVMVDQEGGSVKRLHGPPERAAAAMTADDAEAEGTATGEYLARLGIDIDLAPVVDVRHPGSFLGSRTFGSRAEKVASLACAFATGLRNQGVAATLKHFPGLGRATVNTDEAPVTVSSSATTLRTDYAPYEGCAGEPRTLIMVDSAIYPQLSGPDPAVMSPEIYQHELPLVGADGVTISDDLETPAIQNESSPARRAIAAGLDLLLYARTEATSADAYARLLEEVRSGAIRAARIEAAATKVLALKAELAR